MFGGNDMDCVLSAEKISAFRKYLHQEERSEGTIEKYVRDMTAFSVWLNGRSATKELAAEWKENLRAKGYACVTINSMLASWNTFCKFTGWHDFRMKYLRIQRRSFRDKSRDLTRQDYKCLLDTAYALHRNRLALLLETICGTGIRVSEVKYITVEAARLGRAEISLKGKIRTILLPAKLCRKLLKYARKQKITSGEIFLTASGKSLSRRQIWAEMKKLCEKAGVEESKVFPHNLRHLFAMTFYKSYRDIARLANVLGHSSIETTRIYLLTTGIEQQKQLDRLGLVS